MLSQAAGAPGYPTGKGGRAGDGARTASVAGSHGKAVGREPYAEIMILALATRHRVERPAISMEGGTTVSYGAASPAAV